MPLQTDEKNTIEPLHVGVVLDGSIVPAWIAKTIVDIHGAPLIRRLDFSFLPSGTNGPVKRSALFDRYLKRFGAGPHGEEDPLKPVDLRTVLPGDSFRQIELDAAEWDVSLWLSTQDCRQYTVNSKFGVWRYRHAHRHETGAPAEYFWELYHRDAVSGGALELILPDQPHSTIIESFSATEIGWSLGRNRSVPYWKATSLIKRALRELAHDRSAHEVLGKSEKRPGQPLPSNGQMAKFVLTHAARTIKRRLLYSHQEAAWFIAFRTNKERFVSDDGRFDPAGFQEVIAPADHFYADPFIHKWCGKHYLFFEDYLYAERKGVISVVELGPEGPVGDVVRILDLPYHLSYPFVFEQDGILFMIPETLGSGRIELYKSPSPHGPWRLEKILQENMKAADTTLWIEDGIYYFLTSAVENHATPNDHLHIFWSNELTGDWTAHRQNPVCSDVRNSRGAGKLFRRNGTLIRPAQDCSVRYGYACQLNKVEILTPEKFREKPISRIEPFWLPGMIGTHTLNANEDIEVIDGQVLRSRYSEKGESGIARLQSGWRRRSAAGRLRKLKQTSITIPSRI